MTIRLYLVLLSLCFTSLLASQAWCRSSSYLEQWRARSMQQGLNQSELPLLKVKPGPGATSVVQTLQSILDGRYGSRFQLATAQQRSLKAGQVIRLEQGTTALTVYGDGSRFKFRGDIDNPDYIRKNRSQNRLEAEELESRGRTVVSSLGNLISMGSDEKLIFLGTRYLKNANIPVQAARQRTMTIEVVANIALFGREVKGVPVLGRGSLVAVWFDNSGDCIGLDVNWSPLEITSQTQEVLSWSALKDRIAQLAVPLKSSARNQVKHVMCGYVDQGAGRQGHYLQAGCALAYESLRRPGDAPEMEFRSAFVELIPAAREVQDDPFWQHARHLASGGVLKSNPSRQLDPVTAPKNLRFQAAELEQALRE